MIPVCPKCDQGLLIVHLREVEADVCPACRGLWLDAGELEQLLGPSPAPAAGDDLLAQLAGRPCGRPAGKRRALCPRCDQPLHAVAIPRRGDGPLTLDSCARGHGWWFDANELALLLGLRPEHPGARAVVAALQELSGPARHPQPTQGGSQPCRSPS